MYHKIDLSPNLVFQRWRAYLKSWSIFPSLPLPISERTAHCRKKLHDNKTLNKPFCFPLCKTTSGKRENISHKRKNVRQTKPADACKLRKGAEPLNYIYPHKAYSKHMFVSVILFYHIKMGKSILNCTRTCTPDIFLKEFLSFFVVKRKKRQERKFLPL